MCVHDAQAEPGGDQAGRTLIDGDLVYFNWADYVDPSVFEGFGKEYGVKVIQSNFDSMESMQAKFAAGNRYDIIFPSAQWVQKLAAANQLRRIDSSTLKNAPLIFDHYGYFANPWYDRGSAHSIPFSMYKTGIAWRKDKLGESLGQSWSDLWNEDVEGAHVRPRRPRRGAGHAVAAARLRHEHRGRRRARGGHRQVPQPAALPARFLQRRLQQPVGRRRLDAPDLER